MRRTAFFLLIYLALFSFMFFLSIYNLKMNESFVDIGLSAVVTDYILIVFSLIGVVKTIYHLAKA
jgi:hypothetical protein